MKKFTSLLMMLFAFVGIMNAEQLVSNGVYTLGVDEPVPDAELAEGAVAGSSRRGFLSYGSYGGNVVANTPVLSEIPWATGNKYNENSATAAENGKNWYVVSTDEGETYYFYNIGAGKFMARGTGKAVTFSDTPYPWIVKNNANKNAYKNIGDTKTNDSWVSGGCGRTPGGQVVMDDNENDGGSFYTFTAVTEGDFETAKAAADAAITAFETSVIKVTFIYTYNGAEVRRQVVEQPVGEAYNAPALKDADYATFTQPVGSVTAGVTEVEVKCSQETLPFVVSQDYENATWYFMTIRSNEEKYVSYATSTPYANKKEWAFEDKYMWAFVGDAFGVKLINKAACADDAGLILGYDNSNSCVYMKEGDMTWKLKKGNGGFALLLEGNTYVHDMGGELKIWNSGSALGDAGSAFKVYSPAGFALGQLKSAYEAATNNTVGSMVGQYKEGADFEATMQYIEEIITAIEGGESDYDAEQILDILSWFNEQYAQVTVPLTPGYYFVKGTGGMGGPENYVSPNKEWVLTHEGKDVMKGVEFAEGQKFNANHIWKFETCEDGFKLQQVNLGTYANLIAAGGTSTIKGDSNSGDKFIFTSAEAGKFIIKNGDGHVMRTEDDGRVNYWGTENKETWYLIPATELEVDITAAGWATLHLPFDVVLPETGLKAYAVSEVTMNGTEGSANLVEKTSIPAGEGAILEGAQDTYTLKIAQAEAWTGNKLEGTNVNTYIAGDAYVLGIPEGETEVMLAKAKLNKDANGNDGGTTHFLNNANKAYLPVEEGASLVLRFNFGGNTTAIESVLNNGVDANAPIYDLSGRRVMNAVKGGIYIQNGKKFIVK